MAYAAKTARTPSEAPAPRVAEAPDVERGASYRAPSNGNGAHALQAAAEAALADWAEESDRWPLRWAFALAGTASLFLWALIGVIVL